MTDDATTFDATTVDPAIDDAATDDTMTEGNFVKETKGTVVALRRSFNH